MLALAILQQPARRLARAELELLREASRLIEDLYRGGRFDEAFVAGCAALRHRIAAVVQLAPANAAGERAARETMALPTGPGRTAVAVDAAPASAANALPSPSEPADVTATLQSEHFAAQPPSMDPFLSSFDGADFEELWSLVGPEFAWDSGSTVIF